ncbi:hypothetical protein NZD89_20735 [Alicyclobacillus fastidiosus]|uniref:Uncharacterized protein n=1 Tax=Alicyclobacillus fastidiosus TaxID=392011 RepID=A0ABY6ZCY0_9BACL|nr:hypothetical protein [Alicyclobacillus fastidiosus]WAH40704.1 hypothetical protein NZD89_20735 [Alicyclobacillus fastidiosus]
MIDKRLLGQERRKAKFRELVFSASEKTTFSIATTFFPQHWNQLQLIFSETLGYLDWLSADGELEEEIDEQGFSSWKVC